MTMLEDRIRDALAAEAQAWSDPTPLRVQRREAKLWAIVVMAAAAAVLLLVGGVSLLVPRLSDPSIPIPAFTTDDDVGAEPDTRVTYDSDATNFAQLIGDGETFLGGGYVLGEPWAIVGQTLDRSDEGKPILQCTGVRPIKTEDVCGISDGLFSMALPVGDIGGVLIFRTTDEADAVWVVFDDGTTVEAPFVGGSAGYIPTAVVPIESAGARGTAYAVGTDGDVLSAERFECFPLSWCTPSGG